jgi:hypothetical protein
MAVTMTTTKANVLTMPCEIPGWHMRKIGVDAYSFIQPGWYLVMDEITTHDMIICLKIRSSGWLVTNSTLRIGLAGAWDRETQTFRSPYDNLGKLPIHDTPTAAIGAYRILTSALPYSNVRERNTALFRTFSEQRSGFAGIADTIIMAAGEKTLPGS